MEQNKGLRDTISSLYKEIETLQHSLMTGNTTLLHLPVYGQDSSDSIHTDREEKSLVADVESIPILNLDNLSEAYYNVSSINKKKAWIVINGVYYYYYYITGRRGGRRGGR